MSSKPHATLRLINKNMPELNKAQRTIRNLERMIMRRDHWLYKLLFVLSPHPIGYAILGRKARTVFSDVLAVTLRIHTENEQAPDQHKSLASALESYATSVANIAEEFARASFSLDRLHAEADPSNLKYKGIKDEIWNPYHAAVERSEVVLEAFCQKMKKWRPLLEHT